MTKPSKLTAETAEAMCEFARQGLPAGRAAALVGVHRVTAQRWMREGAAEIAEAADDAEDLGPRAAFAISFESARAEYLLSLSAAWRAAIERKDGNVAKAIQVMMASVSPDEFSERRATRTVDQRVAMQADLTVSRFAEMSVGDLHAARQRIADRRGAAKVEDGDDWRTAVADRPGPAGGDIDPGPPSEEKNSVPDNPQNGSQRRKSEIGGFTGAEPGLSQNISPTRARVPGASVEDDQLESVVAARSTPVHGGEVELTRTTSPFPPDDDADWKL